MIILDSDYRVSDVVDYDIQCMEGQLQAKQLTVGIVTLMRDSASSMVSCLKTMQKIGEYFKDYRLFVFENDSKDDTAKQLCEWQSADIVHRFAMTHRLCWKKWKSVASGERGAQMAYYRNQCRTMATKAGGCDVYIVIDSDLYSICLNGIFHTFSYWGQFDGMLSNGLAIQGGHLAQYDSWAWRDATWKPHVHNEFAYAYVYVPGEPPISVHSAFGGMGIYSKEVFENVEYGGGDCEHVIFHKNARAKGYKRFYVNPSQLVQYCPITPAQWQFNDTSDPIRRPILSISDQQLSRTKAPMPDMIPNNIHFCFGMATPATPFLFCHYLAVKSAFKVNKPDKLTIHVANKPSGKWWDAVQQFALINVIEAPATVFDRPLKHYAHKADVVRLKVLLQEGGIYLDMDTLCLHPFTPLLKHECVMCRQGADAWGLCNATMLARPQSRFLKAWFEEYKWFRSEGWDKYWDEHSVQLPLKLMQKPELKDTLTVLPWTDFFYPNPNDHASLFENPDTSPWSTSFSLHLWEMMNMKRLETLDPQWFRSSYSAYAQLARQFLDDEQ